MYQQIQNVPVGNYCTNLLRSVSYKVLKRVFAYGELKYVLVSEIRKIQGTRKPQVKNIRLSPTLLIHI